MECPCGSLSPYDHCCGRYLSDKTTAPTPEALMRSRYTAYSRGEIDYIMQTQRGKASQRFSKKEAKAWAESIVWLGLSVLHADMKTATRGTVEFIARFTADGHPEHIHEVSQFECQQGKWFYVDGNLKSSATP